jgi:formamidopyrimidine-DNA glycosylase
MPELPEVESFKKYIDDTSLRQKIESVKLASKGLLLNTSSRELIKALEGTSFTKTFRHGKFLFVELARKGYLMLHFGMTGDLLYYTPEKKSPKVFVLLMLFSNGKALLFSDSRKLGKIALVESMDEFILQRGYGDDALKISQENFVKKFEKRKAAVKTVLMNQKIVAGVGNEFSDEILFQSQVDPRSACNKLSDGLLKDIFHNMKKILKEAVGHNADRDKLKHYFFLGNRKAGLKCPRCKGKTEFETIGGRSSYFCPSCQKLYS